ncbi:MAG: hypothetical protein LDL41_24400 [Coleofasciculus sp. S288]|nr:hypothetical protein [Coleofasciculus sp. S288]
MIWTYRVFRDRQERYSIREVFYERDNTIVAYGKAPVVVVGASLEELMQLVKWFRAAFDLPVLSVEEVDAQIAGQPRSLKSDRKGNIPLSDVIAELSAETDSDG